MRWTTCCARSCRASTRRGCRKEGARASLAAAHPTHGDRGRRDRPRRGRRGGGGQGGSPGRFAGRANGRRAVRRAGRGVPGRRGRGRLGAAPPADRVRAPDAQRLRARPAAWPHGDARARRHARVARRAVRPRPAHDDVAPAARHRDPAAGQPARRALRDHAHAARQGRLRAGRDPRALAAGAGRPAIARGRDAVGAGLPELRRPVALRLARRRPPPGRDRHQDLRRPRRRHRLQAARRVRARHAYAPHRLERLVPPSPRGGTRVPGRPRPVGDVPARLRPPDESRRTRRRRGQPLRPGAQRRDAAGLRGAEGRRRRRRDDLRPRRVAAAPSRAVQGHGGAQRAGGAAA